MVSQGKRRENQGQKYCKPRSPSLQEEQGQRKGALRWRRLNTGSYHLFATSNEFVREPSLSSCVGGMAGTGNTFANLIEEDKVVSILTGLHGLKREKRAVCHQTPCFLP
jgi:hypothetical protein